MSDGVKITIQAQVRDIKMYVGKMLRYLVNTTSVALQTKIRLENFKPYPGTTASTLSIGSKQFWRGIKVIPATKDKATDTVYGGLNFGTSYAKVHVGKRGQITEIKAKGKMLAIPLPHACDAHGVAKGSPRDEAIFGKTFIHVVNGQAIIFGKLMQTKGENAGQVGRGKRYFYGKIVPLFVLKNSVKVPTRITVEDMSAFASPRIIDGMKTIPSVLPIMKDVEL